MTADDRKASVEGALLALKSSYGFDAVPIGVMMAQSQLETGAWTSNVIATTNNAFGMGYPHSRPTKATGSVNGPEGPVAVYASLYDSAEDYLMRQKNFGIPNTADPLTYINATVASGYASDPQYATKWAQLVVNDHEAQGDTSSATEAGIGGAIAIGLLLLIASR